MNKKKKRQLKYFLMALVSLIICAVVIFKVVSRDDTVNYMPYTEYTELLEQGEVNMVLVRDGSEYMTVVLFNDETRAMTEEERLENSLNSADMRQVLYPDSDDYRAMLLEKGVIVSSLGLTANDILTEYGELVIYVLLFSLMILMVVKASPASNSGYIETGKGAVDVTFDDVIGHEEVKGDLQLLVKQLKSGTNVKDLSHGVLFEGGAGTGKTMLAKAIANEAGVAFLSVSSSNLVEMYVGLGAKRVRDAFKKAREIAPCVLFFDEIDAVGAKRGSQRSHRENDQTINALLTELDGFKDKGNILVIAATNRADDLDEALLRSGRFDRKIKIEAPKKWETRKELFDHYLKEKKLDSVDTATLAKQTVGFSGADIASVCREARLIAFRDDSDAITNAHIEEAIDKMVFKGNRSNDEQHKEDLEYVAYHEAGHAVMCILNERPVSRVSIMGMTSGVGGAVFQGDTERVFETKEEMLKKIMVAYAGRASEEIHYGKDKITQGASNDITQATKLLSVYVTKYGFDEQSGLLDYELLSNNILADNGTVKRMSQLSNELYQKTVSLLNENYEMVEKLAGKLLETKTLSGDEVLQLLKGVNYERKNDCN